MIQVTTKWVTVSSFLLFSGSEKLDLSLQLKRLHGCSDKHSVVRQLCAPTLTQLGSNGANTEVFGASSRSSDAKEESHQR